MDLYQAYVAISGAPVTHGLSFFQTLAIALARLAKGTNSQV
jgi:hypothetical protein